MADFTGTTAFGMSARLIDRKNGQKLADILVGIIGCQVFARRTEKKLFLKIYVSSITKISLLSLVFLYKPRIEEANQDYILKRYLL